MYGALPRELLVGMGEWTAYFTCSLSPDTAFSPVSHLSKTMLVSAVVITAIPSTIDLPGIERGRPGALSFALLGPLKTGFLNQVRTVELIQDPGNGWIFATGGLEQDFETPSAYSARRKRDRFTSEMLEQYCRALGIDPFDDGAYSGPAILVERDVIYPDQRIEMTLEQARRHFGISPEQAKLPG